MKRLENLGFYRGVDPDRGIDEDTALRAALLGFQRARKIDPTGALDDATLAALLEEHGL